MNKNEFTTTPLVMWLNDTIYAQTLFMGAVLQHP